MTAPRWRLILNGKSADDEPLREAVQALRARGIELAVRVTWERGDAARHVAEALADGVATVIAAGGDGTLGEVAAALAETDASAAALPSLALVPLGTGNDFATAAGLPDVPLAALELVHARPAHPVDLLRITADDAVHWAANLASGGFGTEATLETRDGLKDVLGGLAYLITGMSRLGRIEPIAAHLQGPDFDWQGGFIALGLGNGRQAGGGQALCPDALIDDGLLDLTVIPELEHGMASALGTVMREGKRAALDRVATRARLPWLRIDAPQAFILNLDGEPVQAAHYDVACVAGRVRMHLPTGCPLLGTPGNPMPVAEAGSAGPDDLPGLVPA